MQTAVVQEISTTQAAALNTYKKPHLKCSKQKRATVVFCVSFAFLLCQKMYRTEKMTAIPPQPQLF